MYMSISKHILPVSRYIVFVCVCVCVCDVNICVQLKQLHCWEWKYYVFFLWWVGGRFCTRLVGLQVIANKLKIYYLHVGKIQKARESNSICFYSIIHLIWHPQDGRGAALLNIPFVKQCLCWPKLLQVIFFLCFFIL